MTPDITGDQPVEKRRRESSLFPFLKRTWQTLFTVLITMIGLLFVTFIIGRVMPLDPVLSIVGESASKSTYDAAYQQLGLDKPIIVQFFIFLWDVMRGDFGESLLTARPVSQDLILVFPQEEPARVVVHNAHSRVAQVYLDPRLHLVNRAPPLGL